MDPETGTPSTAVPDLEFHPLALEFPEMAPDDFASFKETVRLNGLQEPITLLDGMIVDGRHRYKACRELGIEIRMQELDPTISPALFVFVKNLTRRHLTASQRAAIGAKFMGYFEGEAKERQRHHGGTAPGRAAVPTTLSGVSGEAREQVAKMAGVAASYVSMAKRLLCEAPDLHEKVTLGEMSLGAAKEASRERNPQKSSKKPKKKPSIDRKVDKLLQRLSETFRATRELLEPATVKTLTKWVVRSTNGRAVDLPGRLDSTIEVLRSLREQLPVADEDEGTSHSDECPESDEFSTPPLS